MKYIALSSVIISLGLNACASSQPTEPTTLTTPVVAVVPKEIVTPTGVVIRPYDHPDIERKSLPSP